MNWGDIFLTPANFCSISSRRDVNTSVTIAGTNLSIGIISSNMDTVYSPELAREAAKFGAISCVHRFCTIEENVRLFREGIYEDRKPWVSIGLGNAEFERAEALINAGAEVVVIDVANAACNAAVGQFTRLKSLYKVKVVVGNFATKEQIEEFIVRSNALPDAVKISVGSGCLAENTRILMANGTYKNIQDIKVHDRVINMYGKPVDVTAVKYSGIRNVEKYHSSLFHSDTYVTADHKHFLGSSTENIVLNKEYPKNMKFNWTSLFNKPENSVTVIPKQIQFELPESFKINLKEYNGRLKLDRILPDEVVPSYQLGYIFGTFLGDGTSRYVTTTRLNSKNKEVKNSSGMVSWYFNINEVKIAQKLKQCVIDAFKYDKIGFKKKNNVLQVNLFCNPISRFFLEFGKKDSKNLPIKYLCSNKEYLKGIYDGLVDSDGNIDENERITFCNTSFKLTELFSFLNFQLKGYYPKVSQGNSENFQLSGLSEAPIFKPAFQSRTSQKPEWRMTDSFQMGQILNYESTNLEIKTYDIEVDCESHSFIANNTVVHNSNCLTEKFTVGAGLPPVQTVLSCRKAGIPTIFDGGFTSPSDFNKALALGCHGVMIGRQFAGCIESGGKKYHYSDFTKTYESVNNQVYPYSPNGTLVYTAPPSATHSYYRGSAAADSYKDQGKTASWRPVEGKSDYVPITGTVENMLLQYQAALRSAMTYSNALEVNEFRGKCKWGIKNQLDWNRVY